MTLVERPRRPPAAINDVVVARFMRRRFVPTELAWRSGPGPIGRDRDRNDRRSRARAGRSGHRPRLWHDGAVSMGQRVFGDSRYGIATAPGGVSGVEARNLAPLPGERQLHGGREPADAGSDRVAGTVRPRPPSRRGRVSSCTAQQAQRVDLVTSSQRVSSARTSSATGRAADRQKAHAFGAQVVGRPRPRRAGRRRRRQPGVRCHRRATSRSGPRGWSGRRGNAVSVVGPTDARPADGLAVDFVVESDRAQLGEVVRRVRTDGCGRTSATSQPSTTPSPPSTPTRATQGDDDDQTVVVRTRGQRRSCPPRGSGSAAWPGR